MNFKEIRHEMNAKYSQANSKTTGQTVEERLEAKFEALRIAVAKLTKELEREA